LNVHYNYAKFETNVATADELTCAVHALGILCLPIPKAQAGLDLEVCLEIEIRNGQPFGKGIADRPGLSQTPELYPLGRISDRNETSAPVWYKKTESRVFFGIQSVDK